jgi:hypothetical protein
MILASAQLISHRSSRIAMAGAIPNARDQKEFTLMGREKIEAFAESPQTTARRMMLIHQQSAALAARQLSSGTVGIMALATSQTMAQTGRRQAELIGGAMADSVAAASHLSGSIARLAHHGLKPIPLRATGNARRLAKAR